MEEIKKSIILPWNRENIEKASEGYGVFVLRTTPVNGDIISIEESENIKKDLLLIINDERFDDINYFDWYEVNSKGKALEIKGELLKKYHLLEDILD
ncbi:MAG: hypothetical protein ABIC36_02455 [bacterium]